MLLPPSEGGGGGDPTRKGGALGEAGACGVNFFLCALTLAKKIIEATGASPCIYTKAPQARSSRAISLLSPPWRFIYGAMYIFIAQAGVASLQRIGIKVSREKKVFLRRFMGTCCDCELFFL